MKGQIGWASTPVKGVCSCPAGSREPQKCVKLGNERIRFACDPFTPSLNLCWEAHIAPGPLHVGIRKMRSEGVCARRKAYGKAGQVISSKGGDNKEADYVWLSGSSDD